MTLEQLEFSISQYLDGSLPASEVAALEARLGEDPAARELLAEYRAVDAMLKSPAALPEVAWEKLSTCISGAISSEAEQFEFTVSQHVDGILPADERPSLQARLEADATARDLLDQHRKLNALLKSSAGLPNVHWNKLASHLSDVIADASAPRPMKLFANRRVIGIARLAVAACVLLASALGIRNHLSHGTGTNAPIVVGPRPADPREVAVIVPSVRPIDVQIGGPDTEKPRGDAVVAITIGAADGAPGDDGPSFAEGIIASPPRSLIASNAATAQDTGMMPY